MNYQQKVCYTILGALIMLMGIALGGIVSPPLIAQHDGVFDGIRCSNIEIVDGSGQTIVNLGPHKNGNGLTIFNELGNIATQLGTTEDGNSIAVFDRSGIIAVQLLAEEYWNNISLFGSIGEKAISLDAKGEQNYISVFDD